MPRRLRITWMNTMKNHLLALGDFTREELRCLIDRALVLKAEGKQGVRLARFIGVDGYRWMIRCVANGTAESIDAVAAEAREALADTVVRRGETPLPVRTPLPVQLPEEMAAQLRAAAAQQAQQAMFAAQQAMLQQQQIAAEQEVQRQQQEAQRQQELEAARLESERQEAARRAAEGAALPQSSEG